MTGADDNGAGIRAINPWDRSELAVVPAEDRAAAAEAVRRARAAQPAWAELGFRGRAEALVRVRDRFAEQAGALVEQIAAENGKPLAEAWFAEILPNIELFTYWAKNTERFLRDEKLKLEITKYPGKKGYVRMVPKGVVAVIGAWNYPVALPLRAIIPALMAGDSVVFKPSSEAVLVGRMLVELFADELPTDVLVPFYGPGALGSAVIEAGVDHLSFIGSVEVGREVAALAARAFTSCSLELGGKDAAIVLPDADLAQAAEGIAWGAFTVAGQNCASIERLLVHEDVAETFLPMLVDRVEELRVCRTPADSDVGPLRSEGQLRAVQGQLDEAVEGGAEVLCGGRPAGDGFGFAPTVLDRVDPGMRVWSIETFGPLLPVRRFADTDEAIAMANDNRYGLGNSLWTADLAAADRFARRLRCGVVTINNHCYTASMPFAPWGGIRDTGMGSTNSHHALMELVRPQTIVADKPGNHEFFWYPYDDVNLELAKTLRGFLTGGGGLFKVLGMIRRATRPRRVARDDG